MTTIVVEGLDFAGKSTVCELVRQRLEASGTRVVESTSCLSGGWVEKTVERVYEARRLPSLLRSAVYHAAYLADVHLARRAGPGEVIVQQSYIHRVLAYDRASGRRLLAAVADRLGTRVAGHVDLWVWLDCPLDERRRRYRRFGTPNERDERRFAAAADRFERELETELTQLARESGYIFIDTASLSAETVADRIAALVQAHERVGTR
ncbi:hypothetical protein ACFV1W_21460 [Kitasatospora sp. NPDC059648]|uniref:hypothetical protein n=1 Tax=Kitasatospora sp. NPDC059648 TaxID=3346894 RepID=UPI003678828F